MTPVTSTYGAPGVPAYTQTPTTNALGLVTAVNYDGTAGKVTLGTTYNPDLSIKAASVNQTPLHDYTYDNLGQLTQITNDLNGVPVRTYTYGYDALGRISQHIAKTEYGTSTQAYTYTPQGQLASFVCTGKECPANVFKPIFGALKKILIENN